MCSRVWELLWHVHFGQPSSCLGEPAAYSVPCWIWRWWFAVFFNQIYNGIIWVNTVCSLAPCVFVHDWWSLILLAQAHLDHDSQASFSCCALRSWKPATKDLCQPLVVSSYYATVVCVSSRHLAFISAHVTNHCDSLPSHGTFWTRLDESQLLPPVACLSQPSQLQLAAKAPSGIIFLFPHSIFTLAVVWNPQTLG